MPTLSGNSDLLGRRALLHTIADLLASGRHVLLVGPTGVGKSALIRAVAARGLMIVDPFERISTQCAARIRRSMDRGVVWVGAAQTLDRGQLGQVGRIAWRFNAVRVPPLSEALMRRLIVTACSHSGIRMELVTAQWLRALVRLARGRPGSALAIVEQSSRLWRSERRLPPPATAYLEVALQGGEGLTARCVDTMGVGDVER